MSNPNPRIEAAAKASYESDAEFYGERADDSNMLDSYRRQVATALAAADRVDPARQALTAIREAAKHPHKGPNDSDVSMLREAAKRVEGGYLPGGSHTTAMTTRVLRAVAAALDGES